MGLLSGFFEKLFSSGASEHSVALRDLPQMIDRLVRGEFAENFFGLISAETGSLYFVTDRREYFLDFEIFNEHDEPMANKFREWASLNNHQIIETTYNEGDEDAPIVLRVAFIEAGKLQEAANSYLKTSYGVAEGHLFDVVP